MLKSLFHWRVLVNLVLAATFFVGLVWLTFRWLEFHTDHGREVPVPNVMNMSAQNAIKTLDDIGLEYEVDSFKYDPKFKPFQVLDVYPKPGAKVKYGRTIRLVVNPRTYAPVQVPDLIGGSKNLAFQRLARLGIQVGDTLYEPSIQTDAVIRMQYKGSELKPGTLLPSFSTIDLIIGSGPKRNILVPNLIGLTVAEAKAVISNNLFELGLLEYEDGGKDDSDIVYYQDPGAGELRDQGMQIDLWASKKNPAELSSKIKYLNSIYRLKIDTTLPPVQYEEVPSSYSEPEPIKKESHPKTSPEPAKNKPLADPKPAAVKPTVTQPKVKPDANKPVVKNPTTPQSSQPVEKPKVKKVTVD